ncbi:MAG: NAD-dependent deacetylase [Epsilonproteobacteria bacterium]|nr:NAD-dependent deacetylase [Campylobacterota bacterium]
MNEKLQENINRAQKLIYEADTIIITAGAGMGVDSGLPDFRGDEGFWRAYPPIAKLGYRFVEMANPSLFENDPHLAWGFYGHRLKLYRSTKPHKGFELLLRLAKEKNDNYFIYTSNVDGQFQKAGFSEDKIYEVHGSIHYLQCTKNCTDEIWENDIKDIEIDMDTLKAKTLPKCKNCDNIARPNILMFGDWYFLEGRSDRQRERFERFLRQNSGKNIVIIEMGAGTAVSTIRNFGDAFSNSNDHITLIRINPRDFEVRNPQDISIPLGALDGLEKILK